MKKLPIHAAMFAAAIIPLHAASDLTNPLNTYSGNSQENGDGAAQPVFLTGDPLADPVIPPTGLEVSFLAAGFSATGAYETIFFNNTTPPVGEFPGVEFGSNRGGGDGRNYFRTVEADYYTQDFTAFVTVKRSAPIAPSTGRRAVFFGLGSGVRNGGFNNNPDQGTTNASAYVELQNGFNNASRRQQTDTLNNNQIGFNGMSTVQDDSMRLRMQYDSVLRTLVFSFDYAHVPGSTFVADQTLPTSTVTAPANEWVTGDRASIYFGGEQSVVFTDLVIDVTQPATPPIPTGLTRASFGDQTVSLTWSSFAIPGTTYTVYRSTIPNDPASLAIATGLVTTSYTDNTVTNPGNPPVNGTTYYYTVTQSNTVALVAESAKSNEIFATPAAGAVTPTGVIAVNGGKNALVIDWADLPPPHTYTVRRSTSVEGPFTIPTGGSGLTGSRFLDQTVVDGTTYFYTVNSTLAASESSQTSAVSAASRSLEVFVDFNNNTPTYSGNGALFSAPVGTTWNGLGTGSVANVSDSTLALSSVGLNATGQGTFDKSNGFNVGGDNATPGSQTLTVPGGFDLMQDYIYNNAGGTTTTYTLTGLVPGRKYDLYLYGYGDQLGQNVVFGANDILKQTSNPAGLTTLTEGRHFVTFTAVAAEDGTVLFTWRNGFTGGDITDADAGSGSALINGFQLFENSSAVLQVSILTASGLTSGVTLEWSPVDNATSYKVYRSNQRASGYTLLGSAVSLSYSDTSAVPGTPYYYVVTALDGTKESFVSAEATGTRVPLIIDDDSDGLSNSDEALIGTNPNDASDFFVAKTSSVTPNGANYSVSFLINGAPGTYVIERSTTLQLGSWTEVAGSSTAFSWNTGTVLENPLTLSAPALAPAPGGKEFFRAKGVVVPTP